MPRVLRIINRFNLGGPTYNAAYLTKYLPAEYDTLLIGGQEDATEANSHYILDQLGLEALIIPEMRRTINPRQDYKALNKIKEIIRDFKPDIVHTHASKAGALGRRAAHSLNVPVIIHTFHGHVFDSYFSGMRSNFYQMIERRLAKRSTRIIALSEIQKHDLVEKYSICPGEKVEIIPLGFDLSRFREDQSQKRSEFRSQWNIDEDEIAIGIVGRIVPVKNHELFVRAIARLKQECPKKIRAFIVGDGESRQETESLAQQLGLDIIDGTREVRKADITFTSWIKDIDRVNAGMDIIALCSLNEGTPVSLIEAQASGKPVVTTRVGGIGNIVLPEKTALLSNTCDVEAFAANLKILAEDPSMRERFGEAGWPWVKDKFHYTRLVNDISQLYARLLSENPRS